MKILNNISCLLLLIIGVTSLRAQNADCYTKKVYAAGPGTTLSISNKYGDVSYIVNNDDSISVCATITITQDNRELARKSLSLITVRIDNISDTVLVSTNFDRKFFSETYRQGRKSFSVDILVKAPSSVNADVTNEFGNVSFEELTGKINVRLSYGLLSAARLTRGNSSPINSITVDNGKVNIKSVNWMSANIRNCSSVEIGRAQAVLIKSDFSKISIGEVNSMVADSKSDIYTIGNVKNIVSESLYSTFNINKIDGKLFSKIKSGSLSVKNLLKDFSYLDITTVSAPVTIVTGHEVSFRSDIVATDAPVEFLINDQKGMTKKETNKSISYQGTYGENKQTESFIQIRSTSGKVIIK